LRALTIKFYLQPSSTISKTVEIGWDFILATASSIAIVLAVQQLFETSDKNLIELLLRVDS
jgi:hypothetical protein